MTMAKQKLGGGEKKQVSLKQIAKKATVAEKQQNGKTDTKSSKDPDQTKTSPLLAKKQNESLTRKESLAVLMIPTGADSKPRPSLKTAGSRLSVASSRRFSVESHRSLDFGHQIGNVINTGTAVPEEDRILPPTTDDSYIRSAIPSFPIVVAVICLIFNIVAPGLGTYMFVSYTFLF